jgi:phospholipid/cholesterol/gamma-HCH transport system substrate-binding protein
VARFAAAAALVLALVVVGLIVLEGGGSNTLNADFQNASGLVTGDLVLIGPAKAGTVTSIGLTQNGLARVTMSIDGSVGPLHQGTVARIYEDSLSGIANKYVALEPGPPEAPKIPDGATLPEIDTHSEVSIDELFNTFDPKTLSGLRNVIRGEAASLQNGGQKANKSLEYLAPALQAASDATRELSRDEPTFDALVVKGAQTMSALASRSQELTQLIANTSTATGAIARQGQALQQALSLFPSTLTRSATAFGGLQRTLDSLDPLVAASKPAVRRLPLFLTKLEPLVLESIPTVGALDALIHNPSGTGDFTALEQATPSLERIARAAFPQLIRQMNASQAQLDYLRYYAPDVLGALTNLGQAGAAYDANGHFVRTSPALFAFAVNGSNQLTTQFPSQRYSGLRAARDRCPGSAAQPSPDGSAPQSVPGCSTSTVPPGP